MPLIRQRPQRFHEEPQLHHPHRELAGLGTAQHALGANNVAEIPSLEVIVSLTDRIRLQEELDLSGAIGNLGKACAPHDALEHHATAHPHRGRVGVQPLRAALGISN